MESNKFAPVTPSPPDVAAPSTPSTEKRVGFKRPTLIIPPPQVFVKPPSAHLTVPVQSPELSYGRKTSRFMFNQINQLRDLGLSTAKSSLGFGEKCAFWLYNKVKVLSRKWFTHCFLTIVLIIYTIGGAISFKALEEPNEGSVERPDLRALRYALIEEVTKLSRSMPSSNQTEEWNGEATKRIYDFFGQVIEDKRIEAFIEANRGDKVWTIWNSIVFCATIYTTIAMESESVRRDKKEESSGGNVNSNNVSDEGTMPIKVREVAGAPEGPQSAGREGSDRAPDENIEIATTETGGAPEKVARRKPKPKRKIHGAVKRELTPIRTLGDGLGGDAARTFSESEPSEPPANGRDHSSSSTSETVSRQGSFKKPSGNGRGSLSELAHLELVSLFNKTKKSLSSAAQRGRERFRKYERKLAKRSQSAPHKFVEELQESLEKVRHDEFALRRKFSDSDYGVSTNGSLRSSSLQPPTLRHRRTFSSDSFTSPKIIEVLDPETSNVVQRKTIDASGRAKALALKVEKLKVGGARDFFENFQLHKRQFRRDYREIKTTFRKCCFELFLIVIFCGLGGVMFKFTEGSFEAYYKCGVKRVKRDFIDLLWTKSHNFREDDWKSFARRRLRQFEEELHSAHEAGMKEYSGMRSWSFLNGIVYSLTIVTTIGYGHMFPKTDYGRALTIVYALIGIPLFLIALTDFGKLFTRAIKFVWSFVRRLYYTGSCRKVRKTSGVDDIFKGAQNLYDYATFRRPSLFDPSSPQVVESETQPQVETPTTPAISNFEIDDEFNLPISVALFILVAYIFCGAVMYMVIEKWNFFEAFYFVFISMSTIGFGDYVPRDPVFMIGSIIYLVFGLALMSMCINVVQAKLSDTFKKASMKIGATMGFEVDEDVSIMTASPECVVEELKPVEIAAVDERTIANEDLN